MKKSELEETLALMIRAEGLPIPERQYKFHPTRKFMFDFAYPDLMVAIECEGGVWTQGRHTRGQGFIDDCEKYNLAALFGWKVLRFTKSMIDDYTAIDMIKKAIGEYLDIQELKEVE